MKAVGWLLDIYIQDDKAVLWIRSQRGEVLRLTDQYTPDFYLQPKENVPPEELARIIGDHPNVLHVTMEKKFTSVSMEMKSKALHIHVDHTQVFRRVLRDMEKLGMIKAYFNIDILHVQRYLFHRGLAPTSKVEVEHDQEGRLLSLHQLDDHLEIRPPPFTTLLFNVQIHGKMLTPQVERDPISEVMVFDEELNPEQTFEGEEKEVLTSFSNYVIERDPDFLVSPQGALRYVLERARVLGLNLQLGREQVDLHRLRRLVPYAHKGRVHLDLHTFMEVGVAGVVERSKFTLAPPGLSAKWPAGRTIDSRQCYEALKRDILLPKTHGFFKYVRTAKDTIFRDRGGLILSPRVGLHENVAELDFESMFPHIIIRENISYETVTPHFVDKTRKGFLGQLTKKFLERRLHFKHLRKKYPEASREWLWCQQRQQALKGILVCIYGYSGCFANRFSNVLAYEEINRIARDSLVKTMNVAMGQGFEVIYADTDSVFVKKRKATKQDYEGLAETISGEVGLPMALDHHYKFLVLMTQDADPNLEATRRYFGKLTSGELYFRGIEVRRHDTPAFLKEFQTKLMQILFDAGCAEDVEREQFRRAYDYVVQTCDRIMEGKVRLEDLVISKVLRKPVDEYMSMFPHVVAAIQMVQKGKKLRRGENIDFLYVNAEHKNPFRRVFPASIMNSGHRHYDREKYVEMALDVAETVLGVFGFDRKHLGFRSGPKDWLEEAQRKRGQEVLNELRSMVNGG